eukprot:5210747-Alexandrium_andersonii.AAC.1
MCIRDRLGTPGRRRGRSLRRRLPGLGGSGPPFGRPGLVRGGGQRRDICVHLLQGLAHLVQGGRLGLLLRRGL